MHCKGCQYSLANLTEHRCPECGLDFDPTDSTTFEAAGTRRAQTGLWLLKVATYIPLAIAGIYGFMINLSHPRPEAPFALIVMPLLIAYYGFRVVKTRPH